MTITSKQTSSSFIYRNQGNIFSKQQEKNLKKFKLKLGDVTVINITAVSTKNIGLAEISNGFTILVPNAKLGQTIKEGWNENPIKIKTQASGAPRGAMNL